MTDKNISAFDNISEDTTLNTTHEIAKRAYASGCDYWLNKDDLIYLLTSESEDLGNILYQGRNRDKEELKVAVGELLTTIVQISEYCGINSEEALVAMNKKIENRLRYAEAELAKKDLTFKTADAGDVMNYWNTAKAKE